MKSTPANEMSRSALDDYPNPPVPKVPTVSIIVPIFNEARNGEQLVADIINQDYARIEEIFFVDGCSDDGTQLILERLKRQDERIKLIVNKRRLPAAGINLALARVASDVVMRFDAHAQYRSDVVQQSVSELLATGAGGVGAIARPMPASTLIGRAIVAAHTSPLGIGVARFRQLDAQGWVDTVWNGCYWMHVVRRAGPLREDMPRAEDNDFNHRIRCLGYGLYLSPKIAAGYKTRQTLYQLWRQYFSNGAATLLALPKNPGAFSLRHLVPLIFVLGLIVPGGLSFFYPRFLSAVFLLLAVYLTAVVAAAMLAARARPGLHNFILPIALITIHVSHGVGSLWGVVQLVPQIIRSIIKLPQQS